MGEINSFAAAVQRWRRERALTLGELAERTSYSASYLSKMVHGRRPLLPEPVSELDTALGAGGELVWLARKQRAGGRSTVRPMQLPSAVPGFVGRERYLRQIDAALDNKANPGAAAIVVIEGPFWVGKTALAVQWASRAVRGFPGGCLFADMRGFSPGKPVDPEDVLDGFLRALGADPATLDTSLPDKAAHYRSMLSRRGAVVLLDNIADYDQVSCLLPGAGSVVLATSRQHQGTLLVKASADRLVLAPLSRSESLALLRERIGDTRVKADPEAANTVVESCGHLPMTILIAAEQLQQLRPATLNHLAEDLADDSRALDVFSSADREVNIRSAIDVSYLALPPRAARVYRLLGVCPATTYSVGCVAALAAIEEEAAQEALSVLRRAHLVDDAPLGRSRMNRLVRSHAYERGLVDEPLSEVERAHDRVLRWYAESAAAANKALVPGQPLPEALTRQHADVTPQAFGSGDYDRAMAWCEAELDTVVELVDNARSRVAGDALWRLAAALLPYLYLTKRWTAWLTLATAGVNAARAAGNQVGVGRCLQSLGWVLHELGRDNEALNHLTNADEIQRERNDDGYRAWTALGLAATLAGLERYSEARDAYRRAERMFDAVGCSSGVILASAMAASAHQQIGDAIAATTSAQKALVRVQEDAPKFLLSFAQYQLGRVLMQQKNLQLALAHLDAALVHQRAGRENWAEAQTQLARAEALAKLGDDVAACQAYTHAADILEALHDPRATDIRARLAMFGTGSHEIPS